MNQNSLNSSSDEADIAMESFVKETDLVGKAFSVARRAAPFIGTAALGVIAALILRRR